MRRAPLFYTILGLCLFHVPMPSGADEEGQAPSEPSLEQLALALLCEAFLNHDNILVFAKQEIDPNYSAYQEPDRLAELNLRRMNQVGSSLRGETPFFFYVNGLQKWRYMSVIFNRPISSAQLPPKYRPRMGGEDPRVWLLALEKTETVLPGTWRRRRKGGLAGAGLVQAVRMRPGSLRSRAERHGRGSATGCRTVTKRANCPLSACCNRSVMLAAGVDPLQPQPNGDSVAGGPERKFLPV